ncbi:MAG: hypothetical protein Q8Q40_06240 [Methylococcaceae bacterium]|nr:hypothetical protein [Methylococcaceae bacterium]
MNTLTIIPSWLWALLGLLAGALITRLISGNDKTTLQQFKTDLAIAEEKLKQAANTEAEFKQLQQRFLELSQENAKLHTSMASQASHAAEKIQL